MEEKTEFKEIYEKSKKEWKENINLIIILALIVGILTTVSSAVALFDFKSQGFDIFNPSANIEEDINTMDGAIANMEKPINVMPKNSTYVIIINYIISFFSGILSLITIIYFFRISTNSRISFGESFSYLLKKIIPLIFTSLIIGVPFLILYFLILKFPLLALFAIILYIPLIIYSVYFSLYVHSVLFREKEYFEALKYSYNLIKNNWIRTLDNSIRLLFKVILFIILAGIIAMVGFYMKNEVIYYIGLLIRNIIYSLYAYLFLVFTVNYFLTLEKEKNISNEFSEREIDNKQYISQNELNAKKYILDNKSQYSKESIKSGLVNYGISSEEVESYLNKYF